MSADPVTLPDPDAEFELRPNGSLVFDGIVIGAADPGVVGNDEDGDPVQSPTLDVNLGWAKAAGVRVRVLADPAVDRNRGGVVLDR